MNITEAQDVQALMRALDEARGFVPTLARPAPLERTAVEEATRRLVHKSTKTLGAGMPADQAAVVVLDALDALDLTTLDDFDRTLTGDAANPVRTLPRVTSTEPKGEYL